MRAFAIGGHESFGQHSQQRPLTSCGEGAVVGMASL